MKPELCMERLGLGAVTSSVFSGMAAAALLAAPFFCDLASALALLALAPWVAIVDRQRLAGVVVSSLTLAVAFGGIWAHWIPQSVVSLGGKPMNGVAGLVATAAWVQTPMFMLLGVSLWATTGSTVGRRVCLTAVLAGAITWWMERSVSSVAVGLVGHTQATVAGVAQIVAIGGVPLISAWLVASGVSAGLALRKHRGAVRLSAALVAPWPILAGFGLLAAQHGVGNREEPGEILRLLIVQPDLPHGDRWNDTLQSHNLTKISRITEAGLERQTGAVDAIIWPENVLTRAVDKSPKLLAQLGDIVSDLNVSLILGVVRSGGSDGNLYRSSVVWLDPTRGLVSSVDKSRAVPVVETSARIVPDRVAMAAFGRAAEWPKVLEVADHGALHGSFVAIPALCYEILLPDLVGRRRDTEASVILNLADDSWANSPHLSRMLSNIARLRAIEQRLPVVRVAHGGLSLIIDEYGRTVEQLPRDEYIARLVEIPAAREIPLVTIELLGLALLPGPVAYWLFGVLQTRKPGLMASKGGRA